MDLDDFRRGLGDAGDARGADAAQARETVGMRARRLRARRRGLLFVIGATGAAVVVAVATLVFAGQRKPSSVQVGPPVTSISPSTSAPPASVATTTTVAAPEDPLGGATLLLVSGRTITALGDRGQPTGTLVTAFAGRTIVRAQLTADHRTIWYATKSDDNQSCPEVVRLDLRTNARSVVAHASDFALTADGAKLLLVWPSSSVAVGNACRPVPYPSGVSIYDGALVVRDLASGAESKLAVDAYPSVGTGGPTGHVWISPAGDRLIAANCVDDGCATLSFTVPADLGAPVVAAGGGPACGCSTLVSGPDGVYGVDHGGLNHPQTALVRYDAAHLGGSGTVVVAPNDVTLYSTAAPTAAGVFVLGVPTGTTPTGKTPTPPTLYRVSDGALQPISTPAAAGSVTQLFPVPPFSMG